MTSFGQHLTWVRQFARHLFYRGDVSVFTVLRVADFRNLWLGQMISFLGDAMAYNTLTLAVIRMANEADTSAGRLLSLIFVLSALPSLLLGMVAGTLVDRANRKQVMIAADVIRGVLALGFLLVRDLDQVWIYVLVSVLLSTVSTFFFPARTALLPLILNREQLLAANGLAQLTHTLSFVIGAAAAGVLVGTANATAPGFLVDSLSFFVSAWFIARIRTSGKIASTASLPLSGQVISMTKRLEILWAGLHQMLGELLVGVRYVFTDQVMRGVLISFLALMLGLGAANVTFVPLLINELGMPEEGLGLIRFSQTIGIVIGSGAVTTSWAARYPARDLIGLSMISFGIMTVVVSAVQNYALMVAVLFVVGLTIAPPQIVASTLMQRHVPSAKLGRASGAQGTIVNVANVASMGAAGLLMDEIGARTVFTIAGVLIFTAGVVSWWVLRNVHDDPPTPAESAAVS